MPERETENSSRVSFYIPGRLPSSSELTSYLTLFQGVLIWSGIAQVPHPLSRSGDEPEPLAWKIHGSYERFLRNKYEPPVLYGASLVADLETIRRSPDHPPRDRGVSAENAIRNFARTRSLPRFHEDSGETNVDLSDFYEWGVDYFGSRALPVDAIDTSGSFEVLFQLAPFLAIIGLQDYPTTKAVVLHAVSVVKSLIGKKKTPELPPVIKLPRPVRDVIVQYDDVELKTDSDGSWRIRLKRDSMANKRMESNG
jgi:hypothetical protein